MGNFKRNILIMSYKPIPFTYGHKTQTEINALSGKQEGDTVYNTDLNLIEIYSGTNWVNNQCFEALTDPSIISEGEFPPPGNIPSGDRAGQPYPDDGGYSCKQNTSGYVELGDAVERNYLGVLKEGTSSAGTADRIVIAFSGLWPAFFENSAQKGLHAKLDSTDGLFFCSSGATSDHVGQVVEQRASTSDTYRNYLTLVQTVEIR